MAESTNNVQDHEEKPTEKVEVKDEGGAPASEATTEAVDKPSDAPPASEKPDTETKEPTPELLNRIRKQVEFYFGDVNMQRDKFLIEQTKLDDGWVPMSIMLNFKMLASLSKDVEVILKALENSDLIEVSEDRKKIRRSLSKPLPKYDENYRKNQEARTIYLKGFPTDSTIDTFKKYFETNDAVENIIMRKFKKGKEFFFKGSILVLFKTLEDAQAFFNQEVIKYKDTELIKMWLKDYMTSKEKEKEEKQKKKAENAKETKNKKNNAQDKFPKGCILRLSNVNPDLTKEIIKEKFSELDDKTKVAFVEYTSGKTEGYVRFTGENSAANLLKQLDSNVVKIKENDVTCTLLEGEEEEAYLSKIQDFANNKFNRRDKGRHGRKNFKRRHSPQRNENSKKHCTDNDSD